MRDTSRDKYWKDKVKFIIKMKIFSQEHFGMIIYTYNSLEAEF